MLGLFGGLGWVSVLGFFFWIKCVGVLGLHGGDGGDEREREREIRERHKYILLCKYIILMNCVRK